MKKVFLIALLFAVMTGGARAQQIIDLFHYQPEQNYFVLNLPSGSMSVARFQLERAAKLHEINVWFSPAQGATAGDSVNVYLFGSEGGGAFPLLLQPIVTFKAWIPVETNTLVRFALPEPKLTFVRPTNFFVGVQMLGDNMKVRMDRYTQIPDCATSEGDTLYTSSFWIPANPPTIPYGYALSGGMAMNNWYIGTKVEYLDLPQTMFSNATLLAGVNAMPEGMRVSWGDYNSDGNQDLIYGSHLYRNDGNGSFTDVGAGAGYDGGSDVNMFVDIDNDGDLDIVCQPENILYFNEDGSFRKVTGGETGMGISRNTTAMSFADYDFDSYPDLFVANGEYIYKQNPQNPSDSALVPGAAWEAFFYGNTQTGKFRDVKSSVLGGYRAGQYGRNPYNQQETVSGYRPITGANWVDVDGDGDLDLYACNNRLQPNYLFENQGTGFLREVSSLHGLQGVVKTDPNLVGFFGNSRGCDFADYDNDGDPDLFIGEALEKFRLAAGDMTAVWTNSGPPNAQYSQVPNTTSKLNFHLYDGDVAWGDFDNDGLLDVLVTSGENCFNATLYKQNADQSFTNVSYSAGIDAVNSLGVAWADYDNDGDLDVAIATETGLRLYRNDMAAAGNWVAFDLRSINSNSYAIGAKIDVIVGGTTYTRWVTAGKGAGSQEPYVQHVGIGEATSVDSVMVRWPDGKKLTLNDVDINMIHVVEEQPPVSVGGNPAAPVAMQLDQNYPNPFSLGNHATTSIAFELGGQQEVELRIYDSKGALVRTLVAGRYDAGQHQISWDGRDNSGRPVASGSYRYVLNASGRTTAKSMVVVR
ncbi:VCBS repeat-containing protein [bacterium]|nr:VCBS repeat-containing protein [bacterium]